jgi:hypothetical protein
MYPYPTLSGGSKIRNVQPNPLLKTILVLDKTNKRVTNNYDERCQEMIGEEHQCDENGIQLYFNSACTRTSYHQMLSTFNSLPHCIPPAVIHLTHPQAHLRPKSVSKARACPNLRSSRTHRGTWVVTLAAVRSGSYAGQFFAVGKVSSHSSSMNKKNCILFVELPSPD